MIRINIALMILATAWTATAAEHERPRTEAALIEPPTVVQPRRAPREEPDADKNAAEPAKMSTTEAAASGALSPFSVAPGVPHAATGLALGGYDGAAKTFRARGAVEGRLVNFLAARVEYELGPANGPSDRLSLGLRAKFLNQAAYGVDLGVLAFYQPRDFRQEGDVVVGLLLARRFDRLMLVLNPLVGSDPEGDDRSVELRLAGLYNARSWLVVGLDSRGRYNLSTDQKRSGHSLLDWEAQAGASAAFGVGPLLFSTLLGPTILQRTQLGLDGSAGEHQVRAGVLAMAGAGASF